MYSKKIAYEILGTNLLSLNGVNPKTLRGGPEDIRFSVCSFIASYLQM
jgi:hypothetical protein